MKAPLTLPLILVALLSSCSTLNVKTWRTTSAPKEIVDLKSRAPEQSAGLDGWSFDADQDIGLAFSGGGTVASSCAIGQLRALKNANLLHRVKYVSTVSGGTWGVLPWVFLSPEHANTSRTSELRGQGLTQDTLDERYLGKYISPAALTTKDFKDNPPPGSGLGMNTATKFGLPLTFKGDENFAAQVGKSFLDPVGLGDEDRYFAWSEKYVRERIMTQPGNERLTPSKFYFPAPGRPFLIANSALIRRQRTNFGVKLLTIFSKGQYRKLSEGYWPVEMTPLYTGLASVTEANPLPGFVERNLGGGFIESVGFNYRFKDWAAADKSRAHVISRHSLFPRQHTEFSLADVLAASGSAPAAAISELSDIVGFQPEFYTWSPSAKEEKPSNGIFDVPFVDGGACDNTGMIQLVAHGVKNIIVFVNSASLYRFDANHQPSMKATEMKEGRQQVDSISTLVTALFGAYGNDKFRNEWLANPKNNHVLENVGGTRLRELDTAFWKATKEGRPLIYTANYTTVPNFNFNVPAGRKICITWIYPGAMDVTAAERDDTVKVINSPWLNLLRKAGAGAEFTDRTLVRRNALGEFPALSTFFSNGLKIQSLKPIQANALAHYHAYNLKECLPEIVRKMGVH